MVNNLTQQRIVERLEAAGFTGVANTDSLANYVDLLIKWNRKTNLTALCLEPLSDEAIDRLIVEPVVASLHVPNLACSAIDLGSGGGSPAIPLRIQLPLLQLRMVESRSKKCAFLREAVRTIGLSGSNVEESRFEQILYQARLQKSADIVTIRAVRLDADLVALIRFILAPGGLVYRFASENESAVPEAMRIESTAPLVESRLSLLQTIRLDE